MRLEYVRHRDGKGHRHSLVVNLGRTDTHTHLLLANRVPLADIPKIKSVMAAGDRLPVPERIAALCKLAPGSVRHAYRAVPHAAVTTVHAY